MKYQIAQTSQSTSVDINAGLYAPILKFLKYNGVSFFRNSRFIIRLLEMSMLEIKKHEIYISSGENYKNPPSATIACLDLQYDDEIDYFLAEDDEYYILYVRTSIPGSSIYAQITYAENPAFVDVFFQEKFTVDKNNIRNIIETKNYKNPKVTDNALLTVGQGYYKMATISVPYDTSGVTLAYSFCERSNGDMHIVGGDVYIKIRKNTSDIDIVMEAAGETTSFNITNINIAAVKTSDTQVELFLYQPREYVGYQVLRKFWNFSANNADIIFEKSLVFYEELPYEPAIMLFSI